MTNRTHTHSHKTTAAKAADTVELVHDLLRLRWSPRAFAGRPVDVETQRALLEAARWAPSAINEQPWRFIVATRDDEPAYAQILGTLSEGNQRWAQQAPMLLISVAKLTFNRNGQPNRWAFHDVGLAMGNLLTQATALGLAVHQMGGFDVEQARASFQIPDGYEPVAAVAIGYPGDAATLPNDLHEREHAPRVRQPLTELVFTGRWGHTSPAVDETSHPVERA